MVLQAEHDDVWNGTTPVPHFGQNLKLNLKKVLQFEHFDCNNVLRLSCLYDDSLPLFGILSLWL